MSSSRGKLGVCLALLAALAIAQAQTSTNSTEDGFTDGCFDTTCCRTAECINRFVGSNVTSDCVDAFINLDFRSGPAQACGTCIRSAIQVQPNMTEDISSIDSISDLIDPEGLKTCCGLGCPEYYNQFKTAFEACGSSLPGMSFSGEFFSAMGVVVEMINEQCDLVGDDWPFDAKCAPRRQDSAAEGGTKVCGLDNDPHLNPFGGGRTTCNTTGEVLLLENDYFNITAMTEPVPIAEGAQFRGASIITSVTFTYKYTECSPFSDNETSLTIDSAFLADVPTYTLREPKLWTHVIVKKFEMTAVDTNTTVPFLTVRIMTPYHAGSGICVDGCPDDEVNLSSFFSRKLLSAPTEAEARAACEGAGVADAFMETCMFDVMSTGDEDGLTASAKAAAEDFQASVEAAAADNQAFADALNNDGGSPPPDGDAAAFGHALFSAVAVLFVLLGAALLQA